MFSRMVKPAYVHNAELVDHLVLTLTENVQGAHVVKGFHREAEEIEKTPLRRVAPNTNLSAAAI